MLSFETFNLISFKSGVQKCGHELAPRNQTLKGENGICNDVAVPSL